MHQSALAEAILTLCNDAEARAQLGEAGRRRVYAHYRQATMLERYDGIFRQALEEGKKGNTWRALGSS